MDRMGHQSETDTASDSEPHQRMSGTAGARANRVRGVSARLEMPSSRERTLVLAINRLEQEHIALLMALCDLEEASANGHDAVMRSALDQLLREDLRRTQHALQRAAQGTYGICEVCLQPLSRRHLSLLPAITRCWACTGRAPYGH